MMGISRYYRHAKPMKDDRVRLREYRYQFAVGSCCSHIPTNELPVVSCGARCVGGPVYAVSDLEKPISALSASPFPTHHLHSVGCVSTAP